MLCEGCQKQRATVFITSIVNGEMVRFDLCPECAGPLPEEIPRHTTHPFRGASTIPRDPLRPKEVHLPASIAVRDLAALLRLKPFFIIGCLMELNLFASINREIDFPIAAEVCVQCGVVARKAT